MWQYQNTDELYHHGVLGMRWGHRKAQYIEQKATKRKNKYLNKTEKNAKIHFYNAKTYSKNANKLKKMSDKEYSKMFDDKEYLDSIGGAKKARESEIKDYQQRAKNSIRYGKDWLEANKEIMNIPINVLVSNKEYKNIINKHMNG